MLRAGFRFRWAEDAETCVKRYPCNLGGTHPFEQMAPPYRWDIVKAGPLIASGRQTKRTLGVARFRFLGS